ncbi:DUF1254 domain-containing protein (plasmid) [Ensifer adhaerens]|uniref:DUF1254 domain-containing protein n=1 Tax=Ensifer adhaerens TaxID=106592 RepID=UPI0023A98394|nr:DUF1254 domain-containing protein [Ensifer adhaerens]WDZ81703.1 DUF1254 domain-containing protein [Ensifer adhaerens]
MKSTIAAALVGGAVLAMPTVSFAQNVIPVTVDSFKRAETDLYFASAVRDAGGIGKFLHHREPVPVDRQVVVRSNRDTLYSAILLDMDAGPATITLPDAGKRFRSMLAINEDHYVVGNAEYQPGRYTYDRTKVGTRYLFIAFRTLVDPNDPKDVAEVHALQDALKVSQETAGKFEAPNWDPKSQKGIRDALLALNNYTGGFAHAFGQKGDVDPVRHLIGTAAGWGGNPDKDATYLSVTPAKNDGNTVYKLSVKDVPVDAFWSISLYNAEGFFVKNEYSAYSLNNITAKKCPDGTVAVQFGGCDGEIPNCLPTMNGWNYTVRLYRPRPEILNGNWKFPEPQPST